MSDVFLTIGLFILEWAWVPFPVILLIKWIWERNKKMTAIEARVAATTAAEEQRRLLLPITLKEIDDAIQKAAKRGKFQVLVNLPLSCWGATIEDLIKRGYEVKTFQHKAEISILW